METGFIAHDLKVKVNAACDWAAAEKNDPNALSIECVGLLNEASKEIGHVDMYNV